MALFRHGLASGHRVLQTDLRLESAVPAVFPVVGGRVDLTREVKIEFYYLCWIQVNSVKYPITTAKIERFQ